jgi:hypothetical protein
MKRKEKKRKEKQFWVKSRLTTIHAPPRNEDDVKTNQMIQRNHGYNNRKQLHAPPEGH